MNGFVRREESGGSPRGLWQSIPLDCILCGLAVLLAAGLKLSGVFP